MKNKLNKDLLLYNLKQYKALLFVFLVGGFTSFPLVSIIKRSNASRFDLAQSKFDASYYTYAPKPNGLITLSVLAILLVALITMSYLNSKKAVDVYHSLPIKRSELFLTQTLSTYLITIIPFTFNYFLGFGLNKVFGFTLEPNFLKDYIFILILLFAILSVMMFVILNTGTTIDTIIYAIVIFALPFIVYAGINQFLSVYIYGFESIGWDTLYYLSPFSGISLIMSEIKELSPFIIGSYWLIISVVLQFVLIMLYNQRLSEKSEEPITNNWFFPMIIFVLIPVIFLLSNSMTLDYNAEKNLSTFFKLQSFMVPLLISFVIYSLLTFMSKRSFKNFVKSTINFVAMMVITVLFAVTMIQTQAFYIGFKLPKLDDVQSIKIDTRTLNYVHPMLNPNGKELYDSYILKEEDAIQKLHSIHTDINNTIKEVGLKRDELIKHSKLKHKLEYEDYNSHTINIIYQLKDGTQQTKTIEAPIELTLNLVDMLSTADYQKAIHPILNEDVNPKYITIYADNFTKQRNFNRLDQKFKDAYLKDISNLNFDVFTSVKTPVEYLIRYSLTYESLNDNYFNEYRYDGYDEYDETMYLVIDHRYPHTIEYLKTLEINEKSPQHLTSVFSQDEYYQYEPAFMGSYGSTYWVDDHDKDLDIKTYGNRVLSSHISKKKYDQIICLDQEICFALDD